MTRQLLGIVAMAAIAGTATVNAQTASSAPNQEAAKAAQSGGGASLAEARGQIDKAIQDPKLLKSIMKGLSAEDQKQFLADVNKAIGDLPASVEEKTALYLNANHAAVTAAAPGNTAALLAETFATVPPESLTVISERFASDLFDRSSYSDEKFSQIATDLMKTVNERTESTDNGSTRSTFAILMLLRASGGTPADLTDTLVDTLKNDEAKELAKNEWIPNALGKDGRELGYEPILASADAGRRPDLDFVLVIAGPQFLESVLGDLSGKSVDQMSFTRNQTPVLDAVENKFTHQLPTLGADVPGMAGTAGATGGGAAQEGTGEEIVRPLPPNVEPYPGQRTLGE